MTKLLPTYNWRDPGRFIQHPLLTEVETQVSNFTTSEMYIVIRVKLGIHKSEVRDEQCI